MDSHCDSVVYQGIHRLKLPLTGSPLKYVNAYLLPSPAGHLLIDTGWCTEDAQLELDRQLAAAGVRIEDIQQIMITHAHVDHYGMAARLVDQSGARLSMHRIEEQLIHLRYRDAERFARRSNRLLRTSGVAEQFVPEPRLTAERFSRLVHFAAPDLLYRGGETLRHAGFDFQVLWTPGHSPGHVCLYEEAHKLFFSGDHVLPGITSHVGLAPRSGPDPLGDYLRSIRQLRALKVELVLPAHGPPLKGYGRRLSQILEHHRRRSASLLQLLCERSTPTNAFELVAAMRWHSKGRLGTWQSLPDFDKRLAITEVQAHLACLLAEGRISRQERDGVFFYSIG